MRIFALAVILTLAALPARAGSVHVAVAANFTQAAQEIARAFKLASGHDAVLSFGASGALYAQITQGAPYEVLLSADEGRPRQAVAGSPCGAGIRAPRRGRLRCGRAGPARSPSPIPPPPPMAAPPSRP